jgi:hypothetical protein
MEYFTPHYPVIVKILGLGWSDEFREVAAVEKAGNGILPGYPADEGWPDSLALWFILSFLDYACYTLSHAAAHACRAVSAPFLLQDPCQGTY